MAKRKGTCNGCKYFNACGDRERTKKCDGYAKENKKEAK